MTTTDEPAASDQAEAAASEETKPSREAVALPWDRLWTVHQAAAFLGRSVSWVYKAAERAELPRARGLGWGLRFLPADVHAYARGELSSTLFQPLRRRTGDK
jgi:predicted DNA-binding transcriptional regulator AlpA